MDRSAYVSALNQAQMVTLGVSALAVIIGLLLAYLISQTITVQINNAVNAMNDTAQVATAMNEMTATVQEVASHAALAASSAQHAEANPGWPKRNAAYTKDD